MGWLTRWFGKKNYAHRGDRSKVSTEKKTQRAGDDGWDRFFDVFSLHESVQGLLKQFVGDWPIGLEPNILARLDMPGWLRSIRDYQSMTYPLRSPFVSRSDLPRPTYTIIDGEKIGRASSPHIDMIFLEVVPRNLVGRFKQNTVDPGEVVWALILHYSDFPLAKLIFSLPGICSASEAVAHNHKALMVIEQMKIDVYKGVENLLFDVYNDLPEGAVLSDSAVKEKLETLLRPA